MINLTRFNKITLICGLTQNLKYLDCSHNKIKI